MSEAKQSNAGGKGGWLYFLIGFVVLLALGWYVFPKIIYSEKLQPVSFSHKLHIEGTGMECLECHAFREDGTFMGVPNMMSESDGACLVCHDDPESTQGEDPREKKFVAEYVAKGKEHIDWLIYSKQPPCVFFPHSVHVVTKEIECSHCHGMMAEQDTPPAYQQNYISGYSRDIWGREISGHKKNPWDAMKMGDCGDCHEKEGASNACFVCHK